MLTISQISLVHIALFAFFVCGSVERILMSFIPYSLSPVLSFYLLLWVQKESMCLLMVGRGHVYLEEKVCSQGSEPAQLPYLITLVRLEEQGNLPSKQVGPLPWVAL